MNIVGQTLQRGISGRRQILKSLTQFYEPGSCRFLTANQRCVTIAVNNGVTTRGNCSLPKNEKFQLQERLRGAEENVWVDFIELARKYNPVKLDLGYSDFAPPEHFTKALSDVAANSAMHQYTRSYGHLRLVSALSKLYSPLIGREINSESEILVEVGAHGGLYCAILGHVSPGDEVIIMEPAFDCYEPLVRAAGGIPKFIPLKPKPSSKGTSSADWVFDQEELAQLFNEKTKLIITNSPSNPLGKVLTHDELSFIAHLCIKHNVVCVSDEVYEFITYPPNKMVRMATLPGMWERTITVCSAGKAFSLTGWKIGWAYGPTELMIPLQVLHSHAIYTCSTPLQEALAIGIEHELSIINTPQSYFNSLAKLLEPKRQRLAQALTETGLKPVMPEGSYFILADWSPLANKINLADEKGDYKDFKFAKWLTKNIGVQGIPVSAFFSPQNKHLGEDFIRFCFIKKEETLDSAVRIFKKWSAS